MSDRFAHAVAATVRRTVTPNQNAENVVPIRQIG